MRRAIHPIRRRPALVVLTAYHRLLHTNGVADGDLTSITASLGLTSSNGPLATTRVNRQMAPGMGSGMGGGGIPGMYGAPGGGNTPKSPYGFDVPKLPGFDGQNIDMGSVVHLEAKRRREMGDEISAKFVVEKDSAPVKGRVVGIDLGTTNSCISYIDKETLKPKIIPSPTGSWVFPTAITFDKGHQIRVFGEEARACARTSASSTLCSGKRLIGRRFGELGNIHSQMSKTNTLTITEKGEVAVEIMGRTYSVIHVTAMFLRYLKMEAEKFLGEPVTSVVVSVPAYFTPQQKIATEDAALAAGFDVWEIIDEPSAACLTYTVLNGMAGAEGADPSSSASSSSNHVQQIDIKKKSNKNKNIKTSLVFDLGGGTLDCALMEHDVKKNTFALVATHGDPMLGGNDWDAVLSDNFARNFEKKWGIQIEDPDGNAAQGVGDNRNLLLEAERAKIHFTHSMDVYNGYQRGFHFSPKLRDIIPLEVTLTFENYLDLTRPLRERCLVCLNKLFEHANKKPTDVDHILLVGAMTRDPPIKKLLEDYFGQKPEEEVVCPADYAVAIGAAIRGGMLEGLYPNLTANTKFVKGTVQRQRSGNVIEKFINTVKSLNPLRGAHENPNAIGQRWRGVVKGLSDEEIMNYAKEMVEFEATQHRRELLERAEDEANRLMGRVARDSSRRQGMQEKRVKQLADQLKFWQYMVHNFHDHEEELKKTVKELEAYLDDLEGVNKENELDADKFTEEGTIKFGSSSSSDTNPALLQQKSGSNQHQPAFVTARNHGSGLKDGADKVAYTASEIADEDETTTTKPAAAAAASPNDDKSVAPTKGPKVLRRNVPLPNRSSKTEDLIEAGHSAFVNSPVPIPEKTRSALFRSTVEDRAWHEPPAPPGESGSWSDVKKALDEGLDIGLPVPVGDLVRPMTCEEMLDYLSHHHPLDNFISPQHAEAFAISCLASEMVEGVSPGIDAFMASLPEHPASSSGDSDSASHGGLKVGTH